MILPQPAEVTAATAAAATTTTKKKKKKAMSAALPALPSLPPPSPSPAKHYKRSKWAEVCSWSSLSVSSAHALAMKETTFFLKRNPILSLWRPFLLLFHSFSSCSLALCYLRAPVFDGSSQFPLSLPFVGDHTHQGEADGQVHLFHLFSTRHLGPTPCHTSLKGEDLRVGEPSSVATNLSLLA